MNKKILWAVCLLILVSLACRLSSLGADTTDEIEKRLSGLDTDTFDATVGDLNLLAAVALSPAQRQVLLVKGQPNRFLLMFVDGMREETWYYDQFGYEVTFKNGDVYTEGNGEFSGDWMEIVTVYSPWQFNRAMGLNELLAISEAESFAIESLADTLQEELSLIYMKGLVAGLRGEDLLFVRTVPVGEGARTLDIPVSQPPTQNQLSAADDLTAAEQVHAGMHTYRTYCTYSDGTFEDYVGPVTWDFRDGGVYFEGEGPFPRVNENFYGVSDQDGNFFIHFKENVITITGESHELDSGGEDVVVTYTCALTQE
jgi:hypothetical protein